MSSFLFNELYKLSRYRIKVISRELPIKKREEVYMFSERNHIWTLSVYCCVNISAVVDD